MFSSQLSQLSQSTQLTSQIEEQQSGLRHRAATAKRKSKQALPVVDISGLYDPDPIVQKYTTDQIAKFATKDGFLYIKNHGVPSDLIDAVYEQAEFFFSRSARFKNQYYIGKSKNHRGYVPVTEKGDYVDEQGGRRYEAFDMALDLPDSDSDFVRGNPLLGPNVWPDVAGFRYILNEYYGHMNRIGMVMCYAFELILGLPTGFFRQRMRKPTSQLRLIHYIENDEPLSDMNVNMGAHTDYECFTILHSRDSGLQVLDPQNNWVNAIPVENTFYFNIGDMLETLSGGALVSTPHRVANLGKERYSIPYFAATDYDTVVKPIPNNLTKKPKKTYPSIVAGEHLLGQLLRDFPYLKKRYLKGEIKLSAEKSETSLFEDRIILDQKTNKFNLI